MLVKLSKANNEVEGLSALQNVCFLHPEPELFTFQTCYRFGMITRK